MPVPRKVGRQVQYFYDVILLWTGRMHGLSFFLCMIIGVRGAGAFPPLLRCSGRVHINAPKTRFAGFGSAAAI